MSVITDSLPPVLNVDLTEPNMEFKTIPPTEPIEIDLPEQTPEERQAEKESRIAALVARVLPHIKTQKIGFDPKTPWLSNPHVEETVRATIEVLYDLEFGAQE